MMYKYEFDDLATGTVADTLKTMAQVLVADTIGLRVRIRSVSIGPADNAASDENIVVKCKRINDVSAGSAGTAAATVATTAVVKGDTLQPDSPASFKTDYSVEPTTYEPSSYTMAANGRGGFIKEWAPEDAPVVGRDQAFGVLVAPRSTTAVRVSGCIEFESF